MESLFIRHLTETDIEFVHESTLIENWNTAKEDIERMFNCNPSGSFITEVRGKRAGHVFSINYGSLGWIGLLIVRAEHRRKNIGTLLMQKAMEHLSICGVETIKLEAVPEIADLYRKMGFLDEYDSLRFSRRIRTSEFAACSSVKLLKKSLLKKIAEFDAEYFGANRFEILMRLHDDYPELSFVSCAGSKIVGYVMCRKGEEGYRIGPWVCDPENAQKSEELLAKCVETLGQNSRLYVGVPASNNVAVEMPRKSGFELYSKSIRMYFGKKLDERVDGVFAIGAPETG